ncbi:15834_t:CDS:2 [Dentiscutata erythropus]|uniref:Ammonium transporter n=1 Tax=Dentiscutata erythropus TaxID=1348616 RepID=A0A9N9J464_9GLOM|nr:15834_t:CDS:2 [Dentiscutata erythropus]
MSTTDVSSSTESGHVAWVLAATCLVWIMTPGVGLLYSGLARKKHALSLIMLCFLAIPIVSVQWFIWGYSLAFSRTGGPFIGNLQNVFFMNLQWDSGPTNASKQVPEVLFAIFECMFAVITPALIIGAVAERVRLLPTVIFIFIWSTLVYDVIAAWCWSKNGWFATLGGLDYAGGIPVHISSGAAALAFCIVVGRRNRPSSPHNIVNVILGTVLLWFGWFGFNGGSAVAANKRAIMACIVTNLAASFSGLAWMFLDYFKYNKLRAVSFCSGAVAGLVAITPASGYVAPYAAAVFGIVSGVLCNLAVAMKRLLGKYDDAMDVFAIHGIGGFIGNILTGVFADQNIVSLNGDNINGGAVNGNFIQILIQLSGSCSGMMYSFLVTLIILYIMNIIPGLSLRLDGEDGTDIIEMGERAYRFDEEPETRNAIIEKGDVESVDIESANNENGDVERSDSESTNNEVV